MENFTVKYDDVIKLNQESQQLIDILDERQ